VDQQRRFITGEFSDWLRSIPARYIVGIAGNHDFIFQQEPEINQHVPWIYLEDSRIELEGIQIYGMPWTLPFYDWAFMKPESEMRDVCQKIPAGLDILLTHGPAYQHLDKTLSGTFTGSFSLLEAVKQKKPDSHVFGHIHEGRGYMQDLNTDYYNVAYVENVMQPSPHYVPKWGPVEIPLHEKQ
jgi:Icc-related predicted phosphoesterase